MRLLNSSGKVTMVKFVLLKRAQKIVPVKFINPGVGWFRVFQRPNGKYVGQDTMVVPEGWVFVESVWLSEECQ